MPLNLRAVNKVTNFNKSVSYRINDRSGKFLDARNVYSVQDRLDTRFGTSRYNDTSLGGSIQSLSSFVKADGSKYVLAKVGTNLLSVAVTGASAVIKSGLSPLTVHRGATDNDRHIVSIEGDGLFSFDGTIFTQLGQAAPTTLTGTIASGGSLVTTNKYKAAISFYSSIHGFESNIKETDEITATSPNLQINLTDIPTTAANAFVDKIYVYLKNVTTNSAFLFVGEIPLGTATYIISAQSLSSQVAPVDNDIPNKNATVEGMGGGKYLASFNSKTVYAGNQYFPNEVYFSEENTPDVYKSTDEAIVLPIPGQGVVTGLGVGLFSDSVLDPFLVIFKRKSTRIYSEIGGIPKLVTVSDEIGCVSHETISVKNGVVYFLSEEGWRAIIDGRIITDQSGDAITLGNGDIDDIFKSSGYIYEVNRNGLAKTFSVYYPTLDQYLTWISEASNTAYTKAYVYEFNVGGFKPYEFSVPATCATLAENSLGRDIVLIGTSNGYILKHSIYEDKSDVDASNTAVAINAFAVMPWSPADAGDDDATYNFRELILKAINSANPLTVKNYIDYDLSNYESSEYDFNSSVGGFVLDESLLDQDNLGDDRSIVTARADINRVGESVAIGFYQNVMGANIGLLSMQIDSSKNGNRNLSNDNGDEEGGFDAESATYYPSVSASVTSAAASAAAAAVSAASAAASAANVGGSGGAIGDFLEKDTLSTTAWKSGTYSGYSSRFGTLFNSTGLKDTLDKILAIVYAAPTISLSCSPSQSIREKGATVSSVTMSATTVKLSNSIAAVTHYRNGVLIETEASPNINGGVESHTDATAFSDTTTFYSKVSDGTTLVQSNTVTYSFVYPYYYGAGATGKTPAQVAALTKSIIASTSSINVGFTTSSGDVYYFAYPASYGALVSILDTNGFETFSDWTLTTANITGLDASAVSYRIYSFNNPVIAGSTNYTFKR